MKLTKKQREQISKLINESLSESIYEDDSFEERINEENVEFVDHAVVLGQIDEVSEDGISLMNDALPGLVEQIFIRNSIEFDMDEIKHLVHRNPYIQDLKQQFAEELADKFANLVSDVANAIYKSEDEF